MVLFIHKDYTVCLLFNKTLFAYKTKCFSFYVLIYTHALYLKLEKAFELIIKKVSPL